MANLLERASIVLTPTGFNNGEALCVKPEDASGDFDFSRNSAATRVNAQGLVENVQILSSNLVQNGDFSELGAEEVSNGSFYDGETDWTFGTGWSVGEDKAISDGTTSNLDQFSTSIIGKSYKVSITVGDITTGALSVRLGSASSSEVINITSNGTYVAYGVAETTYLRLRSQSGFNGSVTNISVKEVDPNDEWSMQASWSIANGKASYNGAGNGHYIKQNASLTIGSQYIAKLDILDNSGNFRISVDGGTASYNNYTTGNGTYSFTFVASSSEFFVRASMGFSSDTLSIDNVSVIEITDDTNLPRINYEGFSYDGSGNIVPDSGCGSWLWEPQTTQLIPYSELFSNSSWGNASIGTTPILDGGYLAPDGTNNAFKISNVNQDSFWYAVPSGIGASTSRSIYARTISGTGTAQLLTHNSNTNNTFTITEQWQRFEINNVTSTIGQSALYAVDFRGSGTLSEIILWGANATNDQDYATSYIPSNGTSVTRNQDVCTNGGSLASINSTEGVLYAEIAALANDGTTRFISISNGTTSNRVYIGFSSSTNSIQSNLRFNGSTQFSATHIVSDTTSIHKVAVKYKANDIALWIDGVEVATDTNSTMPTGLSSLQFTSGASGAIFFGKTKAVAVFPYLSDEELTELTTI